MSDISNRIYKYILFLNGTNEIEYNSLIQRTICAKLMIPPENCYDFWIHGGGMYNVHQALKTKRSNLTMSMKKRFHGKFLVATTIMY